ncbi:MAG: hypothetical protein Alpg2KO_01270 [Alphaproteobacteria bacterium]
MPKDSARDIYPRRPGSLKQATAWLRQSVGTLQHCAQRCRVGISALTRYESELEENETAFMPLDVALALESQSDYPHLTAYLAAEQGYHLVPADRLQSDEPLADLVGVIQQAQTELTVEALKALADGTVDEDEARKIKARLADLQRLVTQATARCNTILTETEAK